MLSSICFMPASLTPQSLPPRLAHHGHVLVRQHRRDVHARRVVPDEERLVGRLRVVAVEEVDDLGRDLLVHGLRALQRQRALVGARLVLAVPSEDLHHSTGRGGVRQIVVFGSTAPGTSGRPGIGVFLHGGATVCSVGVLLMSGSSRPASRRGDTDSPRTPGSRAPSAALGVIAEVVLAELAGVVAEIEQELGERRCAGSQIGRAARAAAAGSCRCATDACR